MKLSKNKQWIEDTVHFLNRKRERTEEDLIWLKWARQRVIELKENGETLLEGLL